MKLIFKLVGLLLIIIILINIYMIVSVNKKIVSIDSEKIKDSDCILILGAGIVNKRPSPMLKDRLLTGLELYKKGMSSKILTSGDHINEDYDEVNVMKKYLIDNKIDESKIIMEDKANNTYENFKFSKEIIEKQSNENIDKLKVKVITTDFHSFRSSILASREGYRNITFYTSKSLKQFVPVYYTREFFAILKMIIFNY